MQPLPEAIFLKGGRGAIRRERSPGDAAQPRTLRIRGGTRGRNEPPRHPRRPLSRLGDVATSILRLFGPSFLLFPLLVEKNYLLFWGPGGKGGKIMGENQLSRLQMVQFECPKNYNLWLSFRFEEIPFFLFPFSFFPSLG